MPTLGKVTAFITRERAGTRELLLFEHPFAGNQIPAGTIEEGETPRAAVLRETFEETGLDDLTLAADLGSQLSQPPQGMAIIGRATTAYARPDPSSWDWVQFRSGLLVTVRRRENGYTQVTLTEPDREPNPRYTTFELTAWVPDDVLADRWQRHFFHLTHPGTTPDRWIVRTDGHKFTLFWAALDALPPVVAPQDAWLSVLRDHLG